MSNPTWQPISTAPTDGSNILIGGWHPNTKEWFSYVAPARGIEFGGLDSEVTHWMPIAPPEKFENRPEEDELYKWNLSQADWVIPEYGSHPYIVIGKGEVYLCLNDTVADTTHFILDSITRDRQSNEFMRYDGVALAIPSKERVLHLLLALGITPKNVPPVKSQNPKIR